MKTGTRAGRVISATNEQKLRDAQMAIGEVLAQLGDANSRAGGPQVELRTYTMGGIEARAAADGEPAKISGYAAVFNMPSVLLYGFRERIEPGAFADSVAQNDIRALWQHDSARVLGRTGPGTLRLWEDEHGLAFELMPPDTQDGRDAVTLIKRGDINQMSFGFNVPTGGDSWAEDDDGIPLRTLHSVDLMEVSPVTWAAYPGTNVTILRSTPDWVRRALAYGVDNIEVDRARARVDQVLDEHGLIFG